MTVQFWVLIVGGMILFIAGLISGVFACKAYISVRGRSAAFSSERNLFAQNEKLLGLVCGGNLFSADFNDAVKKIVETGCELLNVERCSVWFYNDNYSVLSCNDLFLRNSGVHSCPASLQSSDFPSYVRSHREYLVIAAEDVFTDFRTREISESYFRENGVTALMDAPLWFNNRAEGILSFEYTQGKRHWTRDDERVAIVLSSMLALCAEADKRRNSERDLHERESQLHSIAANLPGGMIYQVVALPDGTRHFSYISEGVRNLHGLEPDDVMKNPSLLYGQIHEADRAYVAEEEERTIKEGIPFDVESRFCMPAGKVRWSRFVSRPRKMADGSVIGDGLEIDITARKRTELALLQSEENSRITLNSIGDAVISTDIDGLVRRMNPVAERLTGWKEDEAAGLSLPEVLKIVNTQTRQPAENPVVKVLSCGSVVDLAPQTVLIARDGTEYLIADSGAPIRNEQGVVCGVVLVFHDITDQSRLETAAAQSELVFRTIFTTSPYSIVIQRASDGTYVLVNPAWERRIGFSLQDVVGKTDVDLGVIKDDDLRRNQTERLLREGSIQNEVNEYNTKDGKKGYVMFSSSLFDFKGEQCILSMTIDITEQRRLQTQLAQAQKMDAIGQLAGGIAHDFNNMLGGILGATEILGFQMKGTPNSEKYLSMIQNTAKRAAELTGKLLAFSRKNRIDFRPIDVHQAVLEAVELLGRTVDRKVVMSVDLKAEDHSTEGDRSQLMNLFLNLGINAAHAMPGGGLCVFSSRNVILDETFCKTNPFQILPGRYLVVEVQDSGNGIAPEDLPKIFEPFFTTKAESGGTGLGLAAVYGTVRQHRGSISVYSELGKGTLFHIYFPLSNSEVEKSEADTGIICGTGTILVVDDEDVMRETASEILKLLGYSTITARNGSEAVDIFREKYSSIDLVILDMVMPVMNGREALAAMKELSPSVNVLIASGFIRDEDIDGIKGLGIYGIIRKPYQTSELSRMVHEALMS